jgi:hypothetical protein
MNKSSFPVGSTVAGRIVGATTNFIAEVIEESPLIVKVQDTGRYAKLLPTDFVLDDTATEVFQRENQDEIKALLQEAVDGGKPYVTGLAALGITDGTLHKMLPG